MFFLSDLRLSSLPNTLKAVTVGIKLSPPPFWKKSELNKGGGTNCVTGDLRKNPAKNATFSRNLAKNQVIKGRGTYRATEVLKKNGLKKGGGGDLGGDRRPPQKLS